MYKNSAYNALSFQFVDYLINNETAQTMLEFFIGVTMPEEHYYSTMYMQPGVPGGFNPRITQEKYFRVVKALWCFHKTCKSECQGKWTHNICVTSSADLPRIMAEQREYKNVFHNKYFMERDHTVMDCVEEMLVARNKDEFASECSASQRKEQNYKQK